MKIMLKNEIRPILNENRNNAPIQGYLANSQPKLINRNISKQQVYIGSNLLVNNIKLAFCELSREDINALANPEAYEIFFNLRSPIIQKILTKDPEVQIALLIEELSHELAHILGYGLHKHDLEFFKKQRVLKYKAVLNL